MTSTTPDERVGRLARLQAGGDRFAATVRAAFQEQKDAPLPAVDVVGETLRALGSLAAVTAALVAFAYLLASGGGVLGFTTDLAGALRGAVWVLGLSVGSPLHVGVAETASIDIRLVPLWVTLGLGLAAAAPAWRDQVRRPSSQKIALARAATGTGVSAFVVLFAALLATSRDQFGTAIGVQPLITTGGCAAVVAVATASARALAEHRTRAAADGPVLLAVRHLGRVLGVWSLVSLVAGCVAIVAQTVSDPDSSVGARMARDLALLPNLLVRLTLTGSGAPLTSRGDLGESGELFAALDLGGRTRVTLADVNPVLAVLGLALVAAGPLAVVLLRRRAGHAAPSVRTHVYAGLAAAGLFAVAAVAVASVTTVDLTGGREADTFGLSASSASRVGVEVAAAAGFLWVGLLPALVTGVALLVRRAAGTPARTPDASAAPAASAASAAPDAQPHPAPRRTPVASPALAADTPRQARRR